MVGIAWRGGTAKTRRDLRSVPLPELARLFATPHITFVNLQRNAGPELTATTAAGGAGILRFDEALEEIDETAALLQALAGVVTADSTAAHLAGALGCKTWIMLPYHADWRWQRVTAASPWYPSVALRRQSQPGDWAGVINRIGAELALLV